MAVSYAYDVFGSSAPADTNEATLVTLAATEELISAEVTCTNLSAATITVRVGYGTGASADYWWVYDIDILDNLFMRVFIAGLGSSNKIFVRTNSANNANFTVSGCKKTTT
jgi:hypothetical protein